MFPDTNLTHASLPLATRPHSYIMPPEKGGFDAQCIYWVKTGTGLDELLGEAVRRWLKESWSWWPRVAFPGRDITWNDWEQLSGPTNAQS